jgi:hypothetical protein
VRLLHALTSSDDAGTASMAGGALRSTARNNTHTNTQQHRLNRSSRATPNRYRHSGTQHAPHATANSPSGISPSPAPPIFLPPPPPALRREQRLQEQRLQSCRCPPARPRRPAVAPPPGFHVLVFLRSRSGGSWGHINLDLFTRMILSNELHTCVLYAGKMLL